MTEDVTSASRAGAGAVSGADERGHSTNARFAEAINEFLAELEKEDDAKNPFLRELKAKNRTIGKGAGGDSQSRTSAASLREFVQENISQKRSERSVRILGHLDPFIGSLTKLMSICENLLEAAPFGVSVAFAGARIVLELAQKINYLDIVVEGMEEIGTSLTCYEKLADAYQASPDVQELLVASYKRIIQFWFNVSKLLSKNVLRLAVKGIAGPLDKELKTALQGLRRDGNRLMFLTQVTTAQQTRKEREIAERQAIAKWIASDAPVDVRVNLRDQLDLYQEGTCQWMFEDQRFQDWFQSKELQAVLWYNAKPGSGKSVLAANVIQHLASRGKNVVHFFYSFNAPNRKHGISGLRSLALQLMRFSGDLSRELVEYYKQEMENQVEGIYDPYTAVIVAHEVLRRCGEVYVVMDGIDECSDEEAILFHFHRLLRMPTYGRVKWLFTSRDHPSIRTALEGSNAVEIQADTLRISEDIRRYLKRRVSSEGFIGKFTEDEDSFLYARLMCDAMHGEGLTSVAEIEEALNKYPKNLNGYYMRALGKLSGRSKEEQETARRTFLILIGAAQSISLNEVVNILAVTPGAKDFDPKRLPFDKDIKRLCSPLVVFGKARDGDAPDNPVLTLCHKTIEDFFVQNPDDIDPGTGFTPELRKYFVTQAEADRRLGSDCLTYLQYQRYQKANLDVEAILSRPVAREHAFLRYAATFWSQHLSWVPPSTETNEAVQTFLKSPAFWTCLAVQARVGPYLFGRYCGGRRGIFRMSVRGSNRPGDDCFGMPLPDWIDTFSQGGKDLFTTLCSFVEEWREVLLTCPGGLDSCPPLTKTQPSCHLKSLRKARRARVAHLEDFSQAICSPVRTRLLDVSFHGKTLWADLLCYKAEGQFQRLQIPMFSKQDAKSDEHPILISPTEMAEWKLSVIRTREGPETLEAWKVDRSTLGLRRITYNHSKEHKTPLAFSKENFGRKKGIWDVVSVQDFLPQASGRGAKSVQVIHMAWKPQKPTRPNGNPLACSEGAESEDDSDADDPEVEKTDAEKPTSDSEPESDDDDDDDDDADADSDADSDAASAASEATKNEASNDTSDTDYESEADAEDGLITDCLILAPFDGEPSWFPWSGPRRVWSRINCAPHPTLPLVVVSHTARQIEVIDTVRRTRETKHLPELADLEEEPLASLRELRFSPCGRYLHFLSISFFQQKMRTDARITVSTFFFDREGSSDKTLLRECQARRCRYSFGEALADAPAPLALAHWGDREVVVALPPLTCDPRIVRVRLPEVSATATAGGGGGGQTAAASCADEGAVSTPRDPVYFPASAPRRGARLMYRAEEGVAGGEDGSCLYLALDALRHRHAADGPPAPAPAPAPAPDGEDAPPPPGRVSPPVVLRWKVAPGDEGWRAWDPEEDGRASDLKRPVPIEKLLQGQFVDADKLFSVSIRGGLDWRRKGYLSCATF